MMRVLLRHNQLLFLGLIVFTFLIYLGTSHVGRAPLFPNEKDVVTSVCDRLLPTANQTPDADHGDADSSPVIYFVTPTYTRREQIAELTRLAQTLLHVRRLVWVVAEDSAVCSDRVSALLHRYAIPFVHLISPMPAIYLKETYKPRGVSSRNAALKWIAEHCRSHPSDQGVVYFADDDNTYDLRLFDAIRPTRQVSMLPVGLIGDPAVSSPIVRHGRVVGFSDTWFEQRKFPVDMAGFAVSTRLLLERRDTVGMPYKAGHEEDLFLKSLNVELADIEPVANDCTEILVWHTKTVGSKVSRVRLPKEAEAGGQLADTSLPVLVKAEAAQGLVVLVDGKEDEAKEVPVCLKESCQTIRSKPGNQKGEKKN